MAESFDVNGEEVFVREITMTAIEVRLEYDRSPTMKWWVNVFGQECFITGVTSLTDGKHVQIHATRVEDADEPPLEEDGWSFITFGVRNEFPMHVTKTWTK